MFRASIITALATITMGQGAFAIAEDLSAVDEQPRQFGYFLGDVLTQRLPLRQDAANDPAHFPAADRVGTWFERRAPRLERTADGRRWLAIDYQIVNAPPVMTVVTLPALTLTLKDGQALRTKDWPISLGPLSSAGHADASSILRPDHRVNVLPDVSIRARLRFCSVALVITMTTWLLWLLWRNRRDATRQPFARACVLIKRSESGGCGEDCWIFLHHAINATAGRVIQIGSLATLFEELPQFQPIRSELEEFYRESAARFFAKSPPTNSALSMIQLCSKLRRIERRGATGS